LFIHKFNSQILFILLPVVEGQANGLRYRGLGEPARGKEQTPPLNQAQNAGPTSRPALFAPA